ncbi:MAG TPA: short-chain dehydrogenase [Microbacterium sp.]|uniref:SDR family NAD(P)-dependent oxidoreductase n=1 Tax=Microbacterium sp. UBA1612 TaxID=1946942 RepID=UPI000E8DBBF7|nr:SDR family oxidoreductase [Microbacterium sp. UBA1612]HBS73145.1 short-chain dehydrogenase [Microbacterium sp.]
MFDFTGLRALVTGATSGIGRAVSDGLAAAGADVVRHGLESDDPELAVDLAAAGAAEKLASTALAGGSIDILVLSASLQVRAPWLAAAPVDVERQLRVNLMASLELLQEIVPGMQARGFGRVLVLGSVQQRRPHPDMVAYAASKAALANVVQNVARQLAPFGTTVNMLSPGVIETPRNSEALASSSYRDQVLSSIPAGRIGSTDDCLAAALLLCSRESGYITGQDLVVDGGMTL